MTWVVLTIAWLLLAVAVGKWLHHRKPACFNHKPHNPQHQAEYDCPHCPQEGRCRFGPYHQ